MLKQPAGVDMDSTRTQTVTPAQAAALKRKFAPGGNQAGPQIPGSPGRAPGVADALQAMLERRRRQQQ